MIDAFQAIWLALIQGLTEFLPISSSAHLILVPELLGWPDQGIVFDMALHIGTLIAVVYYFRHQLIAMTKSWLASFRGQMDNEAKLAWGIIVGTVPIIIAGLFFADYVDKLLRSPMVIAAATIGFGLLLWLADRNARDSRTEYSLSWTDVLIIGAAQAVAMIPGTSRSGITMTAGLFLGLTREAAARFSFLLSIPTIVMGGAYESIKLVKEPQDFDLSVMLIGILVSAVTAWLVIHYFLKWIEKTRMTPFVIYRLILGAFLLYTFI